MKTAVLVFPGSNCDTDCQFAVEHAIEQSADLVWHTTEDLSAYDLIIVPGGFSYGDYLRSGAIARFATVMKGLQEAAASGKSILGICNGFQILLEAGLLPGVMLRNNSLKFHCAPCELKVENNDTRFTSLYAQGEKIDFPVAHGEGNYYCDDTTLARLQANRQIVFRYTNNPNGSVADIAGICNEAGNILGLMPHPERAVQKLLGSTDGVKLLQAVYQDWRERHGAASTST